MKKCNDQVPHLIYLVCDNVTSPSQANLESIYVNGVSEDELEEAKSSDSGILCMHVGMWIFHK